MSLLPVWTIFFRKRRPVNINKVPPPLRSGGRGSGVHRCRSKESLKGGFCKGGFWGMKYCCFLDLRERMECRQSKRPSSNKEKERGFAIPRGFQEFLVFQTFFIGGLCWSLCHGSCSTHRPLLPPWTSARSLGFFGLLRAGRRQLHWSNLLEGHRALLAP